MKLFYYLLLTTIILTGSCKSLNYIHFVPYTNKEFVKTDAGKIEIYDKRLDLPAKYFEIGVLKIEGEHSKSEILNKAAEKGADAIIFEANNVVLIHFYDKTNEDDEKNKDIY
jgi:hypothetical protein